MNRARIPRMDITDVRVVGDMANRQGAYSRQETRGFKARAAERRKDDGEAIMSYECVVRDVE